MKIFSAAQIRQWDQFTIQEEPISSYDLMERASHAFVHWFTEKFPNDHPIHIFCGTGNNGGDGLAVARLLHQSFYNVQVVFCEIGSPSPDCQINLDKLEKLDIIQVHYLAKGNPFPTIPTEVIVIDAIFGSGLNRPITGYWADLIDHINKECKQIVAIDVPSGLYSDQTSRGNTVVEAKHTFCFERPKLSFFLPENFKSVGTWDFASIGLHPSFVETTPSHIHLITESQIKQILKHRNKFDHKGTYGHALLVVGSYGKVGAGILAARACLRSGVGLLSVNIPKCGYDILQSQVPEAMVIADSEERCWTTVPDLQGFKAIGIGCGLGQLQTTRDAFKNLLESVSFPVVLDADALNIIGKEPGLLELVPKKSILTPHPKEFERLFGSTTDDFERLELLQDQAKSRELVILLKGAHTIIALPNGECYFNTTGNPGMATGGSGDALTGMITSFLAQGYSSEEATILGVYIHGSAGDVAVSKISENALLPSDLIDNIGKVFLSLKN